MSTSPRQSDIQKTARQCFQYALNSVAPAMLIQDVVRLDSEDTRLELIDKFGRSQAPLTLDLQFTPSLLIVGAGKATQELVEGILQAIADHALAKLEVQIVANFPKGQSRRVFPTMANLDVKLYEASHPISDQATIDGTTNQLEAIQAVNRPTILIVLLSGGGSALFETTQSQLYGSNTKRPTPNINLQDLQQANKVLLDCGANISEINTIRKHISQVKGGRLAEFALSNPNIKHVVGLYLSDVVGNDLSSVASGPTCPDVTTFADCAAIVSKYGIKDKLPISVQTVLDLGLKNKNLETPKPGNPIFESVSNLLIGSADSAALASMNFLNNEGYAPVTFSNKMDGEASEFGKTLPDLFNQLSKQHPKADSFVATGEFTVTIKGKGVGGRNQEMLLALAKRLASLKSDDDAPFKGREFAIVSAAFDGIEGNSNVAGAVVDHTTVQRLQAKLNKDGDKDLEQILDSYLQNNDSHSVFDLLGDTIDTGGSTGTNVNDLTVVITRK